MDDRGIGDRFLGGARIHLSIVASRRALGPQRIPGEPTRGKEVERESNHSPPSSVDVKNGGAKPPLPHTSSWRGA
jgi:hypothetical protein